MKTLNYAALIAALLAAQTASASVDAFVGTFRAEKGSNCSENKLTVARKNNTIKLTVNYAGKSQPEVLQFVNGASRPASGGGEEHDFITVPEENALHLVRSETDFRDHPRSLLSITLTKTDKGLKFRSTVRNSAENPMNCTYTQE